MAIRIAIAGLGGAGRNNARRLRELGYWEVVGGCDILPEPRRLAKEELGIPTYETTEELVQKAKPEVVFVATSSFAHVEPTVTALQAGVHVVVEKPMAVNLQEADQMMAAAQASGGELFVGHNRRGDGDFITLESIVTEGLLGELKILHSRLMANPGQPEVTEDNWRLDPARGGGCLLDWGPHLVDQVLALVPSKPQRLLADLATFNWEIDIENYFRIQLWFENGAFAEVEYNNAAPLDLPRFYVLGDRACCLKLGMEGCVQIPSLLHTDFLVRDYETGNIQMVPQQNSDHMRLWRNLADVLEGLTKPLVPLQHAYQVMAVLDAARRSAESGQVIEL